MSESDWIALPDAVLMIAASGLVERSQAVPYLLALAKEARVGTRIGLQVDCSEGAPRDNVPMDAAHWRDLERADADWLNTGDMPWGDGFAWLNIQIHEGHIRTNLRTLEQRVRPTLQPVAPAKGSIRSVLQPDRQTIGNARQQIDNRIAVTDAIGLGECCRQLADRFNQSELQPEDYVPAQLEHYQQMSQACVSAAEAQRWVKACIMTDKATQVLGRAIATGGLRLWRIHEAREVLIAPTLLEREIIKLGIYKTLNHLEPDMQGALLWVKQADWAHFFTQEISTAQPGAEPVFSDEERRQWMRDYKGPSMAADNVWREYRKHPREDGTKQTEWRREWGEVVGNPRGGQRGPRRNG